MRKTLNELERDATEFRHKFATEYYTQVSDDYYDVDWVYTNGLRAYIDVKLHFTGINTIWNLRSNNFEGVFLVKSNNAIANWDCDDPEKWADNGFKGIKAIVVKGEGSELWHYITPKAEDYQISRGYATCEDCIKDTILYAQ